ncbi:MAG: helix-turn-helix transcriptional regulator [Deltaproteobacteria bacterium]|nr:helix-turn-helix transcriptional regulator [Deltaproteobacteria bacterium]
MAMKQRKSQRTALYETATYVSLVGRIGANVRRLRHGRGWTQEECAFRCNDLGPALLRTIESGRTNITAATIARLCDGLGVDAARALRPRSSACEAPAWTASRSTTGSPRRRSRWGSRGRSPSRARSRHRRRGPRLRPGPDVTGRAKLKHSLGYTSDAAPPELVPQCPGVLASKRLNVSSLYRLNAQDVWTS